MIYHDIDEPSNGKGGNALYRYSTYQPPCRNLSFQDIRYMLTNWSWNGCNRLPCSPLHGSWQWTAYFRRFDLIHFYISSSVSEIVPVNGWPDTENGLSEDLTIIQECLSPRRKWKKWRTPFKYQSTRTMAQPIGCCYYSLLKRQHGATQKMKQQGAATGPAWNAVHILIDSVIYRCVVSRTPQIKMVLSAAIGTEVISLRAYVCWPFRL